MDVEIHLDDLIELPLVSMDEQEAPNESDPSLESLLIEDLSDVDDMA